MEETQNAATAILQGLRQIAETAKAQNAEIVLSFDRNRPARFRYVFYMEEILKEIDARRQEAEFDTEAAA